MAGEDGNRMLIALVALLVIALGVVVYLWQQEEQEAEVEFDLDTEGAAVRVERDMAAVDPDVPLAATPDGPERVTLAPIPAALG